MHKLSLSAIVVLSIGIASVGLGRPAAAAGWASCRDDLATHTWACVQDGKVTTGHYENGRSVVDKPVDVQLDGSVDVAPDQSSDDMQPARNGSPDNADRTVDPTRSTICLSDDECGPGSDNPISTPAR